MLEPLKELKELAMRGHYYCEDGWYSCPKAPDGCCNDCVGDDCNCGADTHNELVERCYNKILECLSERNPHGQASID